MNIILHNSACKNYYRAKITSSVILELNNLVDVCIHMQLPRVKSGDVQGNVF